MFNRFERDFRWFVFRERARRAIFLAKVPFIYAFMFLGVASIGLILWAAYDIWDASQSYQPTPKEIRLNKIEADIRGLRLRLDLLEWDRGAK